MTTLKRTTGDARIDAALGALTADASERRETIMLVDRAYAAGCSHAQLQALLRCEAGRAMACDPYQAAPLDEVDPERFDGMS